MLAYLRAAQAYMLISMPTSTSTIFGVFQVIGVSQALLRRDVHAGVKGKAAPDITQEFHINVVRCSGLQRYFLSSWNNRFDKYRMRFDGGPEDQSSDRFRAVNRKRSIYELSQQSQERLSSAGI